MEDYLAKVGNDSRSISSAPVTSALEMPLTPENKNRAYQVTFTRVPLFQMLEAWGERIVGDQTTVGALTTIVALSATEARVRAMMAKNVLNCMTIELVKMNVRENR